jgi:hypothetical protein
MVDIAVWKVDSQSATAYMDPESRMEAIFQALMLRENRAETR